MPTFKYKALNRSGDVAGGRIDASSEIEAIEQISARKLDVFEISKLPPQVTLFSSRRKVTPKTLARYVRQLATLLNAGVTLMEALSSLARSNANPALAEASRSITSELRSGNRLSVAMEMHLPQLPKYVPRLAELGEATGQSAKALTDAADRMEFEDEMRVQLRTALSYPIFLSVVGSLIITLMFLFVVPKFDDLIGDNRESLPAISKIVLSFGSILKSNFSAMMILSTFIAVILVFTVRNPVFKRRFRSSLERIVVVGPLLVQSDLGGWSRTVGMALSNGAPLLEALKLGEFGLRSPRLQAAMKATRREIRTGRNIDEVLEEIIPDFDPLTIDLIRTGRASGSLADMFLFVGKMQEKETQELAKRLSSLAEPIAILSISAIVGTIVISIVLAMTSLYDFAI